jgi:hypothetical protein
LLIFAANKGLSYLIVILATKNFSLLLFYLYFLSCLFILCGCDMVGKVYCGIEAQAAIGEVATPDTLLFQFYNSPHLICYCGGGEWDICSHERIYRGDQDL